MRLDDVEPPPQPTKGTWFVTFTDIVCLMLAFFVMLYAMSSVNAARWAELAGALAPAADATNAQATSKPAAHYNIANVFRKRAINLDYLHAVLKDLLAADDRLKNAHLHLLEDRLVISLPGDILFAPAEAKLDGRAEPALFALGGVLGNLTNPVAVIGHSDPVPPAGTAYASNWELTVDRAAAVAAVLKQSGYTREVAVFGAGDTRYGDVAELPAARRDAVARRVDVVILAGGV